MTDDGSAVIRKRIEKLTPAHLDIAQRYLRGQGLSDIARETGMTRSGVEKLLQRPYMAEYINDRMEARERRNVYQEELAAEESLKGLLRESRNMSAAARDRIAALEVLARIGFSPRRKQSLVVTGAAGGPIEIVAGSEADAEMRRRVESEG